MRMLTRTYKLHAVYGRNNTSRNVLLYWSSSKKQPFIRLKKKSIQKIKLKEKKNNSSDINNDKNNVNINNSNDNITNILIFKKLIILKKNYCFKKSDLQISFQQYFLRSYLNALSLIVPLIFLSSAM